MPNQTVKKQCQGLFSHPSKILLPPGALRQAKNCVLTQEGVCGKRRGFERHGEELDLPAEEAFLYRDTLLAYLNDTLFVMDESWDAWTGTFAPPSSDIPMTALEANGCFLFTTSSGVFVNDALENDPVRAGMPPGLDMELLTVGIGGSWFSPNTQVGYRIVWMRRDAQENEKRGDPSYQEIATSPIFELEWTRTTTTATVTHEAHGYSTNDIIEVSESSDVTAIPNGTKTITVVDPDTYTFDCLDAGDTDGTLEAGKAFDVELTFTIPLTDGVVEGDYYEIYRSALSATEDDAPSDEHRLVMRGRVTSTDISTGTITVLDDVLPAFLQEPLYTNQNTGQGSNQANGRPPFCACMATYQGHTFYGDYRLEEQVQVQLLDVESLTDGVSSVTITLGASVNTYTFETAEDIAAHEFERFTTSGEGTLAAAVRKTAKSLVRCINRDPDQEEFYAHYVSSPTDAPGKILLKARKVNTNPITVTCDDDMTTGPSFEPALPESGESVISTHSANEHGLLRGKFQQPEAVPFFNSHKVGSKTKKVLALVSLKEALLIFKEDGLFVLSGTSDGGGGFGFRVDPLDPSVILLGRRNIGILDSAAVALTTQGVMRCSPSGTSILSRQIERDLLRTSKFSNFERKSFLVTYETDRKLLLWVPERNSDETAKFAYVFDYLAPGWTTYDKPASCGLVIPSDDRLILGHATDPFFLRERKSLRDNNEDFIDEHIPAEVLSVVGTDLTVEFDYDQIPTPGWLFRQGNHQSKVATVQAVSETQYILTLEDQGFTVDVDECELCLPIVQVVEWAPEDAGSAAVLKFFSTCNIYIDEGYGRHNIAFRADTQGSFEYLDDFTRPSTSGWGSGGWGDGEWGQGSPELSGELRTIIPRNHRKCRTLSVLFENHAALENPKILQCSLDVRLISSRTERRGARGAVAS